jgi:hypothetical protein
MPSLTGCPGVVLKAGSGTNAAASIDSAALHPLGTRSYGTGGEEYIYLQGIGSTVAGSVVTYDDNGLTTLVVANATGPVAVAQAATVASTFGWYAVRSGLAGMSVACDTGITDNAKVYIDGTAGRVDDTVVAGDQIANMLFRSTDTGNLVTAQFDYPFATDGLG